VRITCVGGGPAGLYFALLMKRADNNHDITLIERNQPDVTHGWGVVFWDDLIASLRESDPETAREIEAAAYQWHGLEVHVEGKAVVTPDTGGFSIARHTLIEILSRQARAAGVRVEYGREGDPAQAFPDADLVVVSEGAGSRFRKAYAAAHGTDVVRGRSRYVWLGTTKVFDSFTFAFVKTAAGWLWCHTYGYAEDRSTFIVECTEETWRGLGFDRLDLDESLGVLQEAFAAHLDGHPLMVQSRQENKVPWLTFATVRNQSWHRDNVVLMGDAAHTTHFSIGSGTKLALQDAIALAGALGRHDEITPALEEYEKLRSAAIVLPQRDSLLSSRFYENVPKYIQLEPEKFSDLMDRRRSRVLPRLGPATYLRLCRAVEGTQALRPRLKQLRSRASATFERRTP
jgi:anthraniloyl-CoA monooxygenase